MSLFLRSLLFVAVLVVGSPLPVEAEACFDYEPATSSVSGKITKRLYFGPPFYGEDPDHDLKETALILQPDKPICVNGDPENAWNSAEPSISEMHMYFAGDLMKQAQISKHVEAKGVLFRAQSRLQQTPVLIYVTELRELKN